jgi:hypothetical protein
MLIWYYDPMVGILTLGIGIGFGWVVLYTGLIHLIQPHLYGKGFSILIAFNNIGFTIVPLVVSLLRRYYLS